MGTSKSVYEPSLSQGIRNIRGLKSKSIRTLLEGYLLEGYLQSYLLECYLLEDTFWMLPTRFYLLGVY